MNVKEMQKWINNKIKQNNLSLPLLVEDGIGGPLTRSTFIMLFVNKKAEAITETQLLDIVKQLNDKDTRRIKAVATVESGGSGWFSSGLPKILYERHLFTRFTNIVKEIPGLGWIGYKTHGGYSNDINNNDIQDSWEKLSYAVCIDPDKAIQSISIGKFQVLGQWYKELGYNSPLDMLWDARDSELGHYRMLVGYIKNVANLQYAFLQLSTNPETCRNFAKGYNGPKYMNHNPGYHIRLARAL